MSRLSGAVLLFSLQSFLLVAGTTRMACAEQAGETGDRQASAVVWSAREAEHVLGFPEVKPNEKGILTLSAGELVFSAKSGEQRIPRRSLMAVNVDNQRVEMWGVKGRILRMVIPDGGGLLAAAFMHHRVNMLTVEFSDPRGGYHGAVFYLSTDDAAKAQQAFAGVPAVTREPRSEGCRFSATYPGSVLVPLPGWEGTEAPAAYRALVYERVLDRLQHTKGVEHVFRDGEKSADHLCPQFTVRLSLGDFKQGSQVKRAVMGPVGMFAGATRMTFDATVTDAAGRVEDRKQIEGTVRGESESIGVAAAVAKKVAKRYSKVLKTAGAAEAPKHRK